MSISSEVVSFLDQEESIFTSVVESLQKQIRRDISRFSIENERARSLTAAIVGTNRAEDKAMLASDEAVSHGLTDQKKKDVTTIEALLKKPYFARIVLEEAVNDGSTKTIEYKLGVAANPDCRIVDWRKAPIAKLYYEYKEGDEYSEQILGKERTGRVVLRNTLEVDKVGIKRITCRFGTFEKKDAHWVKVSDNSKPKRTDGSMPDILSLITEEQFRTITEEANSAILIQGVAGSGKTTVALHRLAWLLHPENSPLKPHEAVFVVLSKALKNYVFNSLPKLEVHGVRVLTFKELAAETLGTILPNLKHADGTIRRPVDPTPRGIDRVKRSMAVLIALENFAKTYSARTSWAGYEKDLLAIFSQPRQILELDDTGLLDLELINSARARIEENIKNNTIDFADDALLLRLIELKTGNITLRGGMPGKLKHIAIDEVQDYSPSELAALIGAVDDTKNLTIVGDASQSTDENSTFPGWDNLRERWAFKDAMSSYVSLKVSHRSTLQIMKLADAIQGRDLVTDGRIGRVPIWFKCSNESSGIGVAREWLSKAMERYPGYLTAVICSDVHEAKYVVSLLSPTFGGGVRLGDEYSFSFDEGIVVAAVKEVKGLEFTNVLLWNPSAKSYPVSQEMRNALYIAVTRAEENLSIVTWGKPTDLLPGFGSQVVRGADMRGGEES